MIGDVDRIFTRIGSSDDLAGGRSTFMVEMTETAMILNNATEASLVLLDEIGRGTSTFDGLSLAWATARYIGESVKAMTLFATHYFEMTALADQLPGTFNLHLTAREHEDRIIFMYAVNEGPASQSYGLQVAKLAGVPEPVIRDARDRLRKLETGEADVPRPPSQADLFAAPAGPDPIREQVASLNPESMTPLEAMQALFDLKSSLDDDA